MDTRNVSNATNRDGTITDEHFQSWRTHISMRCAIHKNEQKGNIKKIQRMEKERERERKKKIVDNSFSCQLSERSPVLNEPSIGV